jgi:hypothetical protein
MTRKAHLWFFVGVLLAFTIALTFWLMAVLTGQLWSTQWGLLLPIAEGIILLMLLRRWIAIRRDRARQYDWISRELRCRWNWPQDGHRVRFA